MTRKLLDWTELIFLTFGFVFVSLAVVGGIRAYSPVPFWDMWDGYLGFYVKVSSGDWTAWWAQHNEHRIVLARLLFWLDIAVLQGTGWFLVLVNYLLLAMVCALFFLAWREQSRGGVRFVGLFLVAWLFSWSQENNLTWGFQSQFILAQLLPLAAFYLFHKSVSDTRHSLAYFAAATLFGFLAIGSMANGVLTLPLLTLFCTLVRCGRRRCSFLAVLSILSLWAYFYAYSAPGGHGSLGQALRENPGGLMQYVFVYIGGPFYFLVGGGAIGLLVAKIAGAFLIFSAVLFAWRALQSPAHSTLSLAMLFFILYVGGTAFGTAGGRLMFGVEQALSSRYMTPALMAWAALLLLYFPKIETLSHTVRAKLWMPFLLLILLMLPQQLKALASKKDVLFERNIAALALELGVRDQTQIGSIFPSADWAQSISVVPIARNLSIFGVFPIKDSSEIVGYTISETSQPDHQCQGAIDEVQSVEGDGRYLRIRGWFFDPVKKRSAKSVRLVDGDGVVQGIVLTGQSRPDVAHAIDPAAGVAGFKGYVHADAQGKTLFLRDPEGGCQLTATVSVILFHPAKVTDSLPVSVSVKQIQPLNEWRGSDFQRSSIPGLSVFGSFIQSDSDYGSIVLRLHRRDKLLYRSGPSGGQQSVQVIANPELTALLPAATEWIQLDFSSALLPEVFEIKFTDNGDGWGKWSAIALKMKG